LKFPSVVIDPPVAEIYETAVIELLAALAGPVPTALVAVTVNVYAVPVVKPVTTIGEDAPVPVTPPGLDVTVYEVIAVPPLLAGAVNVTVALLVVPAVAVPMVGAPGIAKVVTLALDDEATLVPTALVAVTVNVYAVPVVKPFTVIVPEPA
jgi:hypothetical protein